MTPGKHILLRISVLGSLLSVATMIWSAKEQALIYAIAISLWMFSPFLLTLAFFSVQRFWGKLSTANPFFLAIGIACSLFIFLGATFAPGLDGESRAYLVLLCPLGFYLILCLKLLYTLFKIGIGKINSHYKNSAGDI